MSTALCEMSPEAFVKRAVVPKRKRIAALVGSRPDRLADAVGQALRQRDIPFANVALESAFNERPTGTVLIATTSEDEAYWRRLEGKRGRMQVAPSTMLVLSEGAAGAMQRNAPQLAALIGPMQAAEQSEVDPLTEVLAAARAARYPALYEAAEGGATRDLEEVTSEVLAALGDPSVDDHAWRRSGFIGRAMLLEVESTLAANWPPGLLALTAVRIALDSWLASTDAPPPPDIPLPQAPVTPQATTEAMIVVANAARLMDRSRARTALTEILDAAFQGYAIIPGSEGRRAIFEWWLDEVVPKAVSSEKPVRLEFSAHARRHE